MSEGDGKERLVEWLRSGVCIRQAASHSGVEVDMRATVDLMAEAADTIASLTTQLETERERATKAEERCEAYKGQVEAGAKVIESLKADLREKAMWYLSLEGQATEALARAVKAEEEASALKSNYDTAQANWNLTLERAEKAEEERDRLLRVFAPAGADDWRWLENHLPWGGHGRFWRTTLRMTRNILSALIAKEEGNA